MGFGMCGANKRTPPQQTPQQALDAITPLGLRLFFQQGSGPNGGSGNHSRGHCKTSTGVRVSTPASSWFTANAVNAGGYSAICLLTAQRLREAFPHTPVGAVESCVGGTEIALWTPPAGKLWSLWMEPLTPFTFAAALWDQGENDFKHGGDYYGVAFPQMIQGWRDAFRDARLPFVYVEMDTAKQNFWLGQRNATRLPAVGFVTTADLQRGLHPPDKQDIASRLANEVRRVAYNDSTMPAKPTVKAIKKSPRGFTVTFSDAVTSHGALFASNNSQCGSLSDDSVVVDITAINGTNTPRDPGCAECPAYELDSTGTLLTVACPRPDSVAQINGHGSCYLYSDGVPVAPFCVSCNDTEAVCRGLAPPPTPSPSPSPSPPRPAPTIVCEANATLCRDGWSDTGTGCCVLPDAVCCQHSAPTLLGERATTQRGGHFTCCPKGSACSKTGCVPQTAHYPCGPEQGQNCNQSFVCAPGPLPFDSAGLPVVLVIGDSISIGWTPQLKRMLANSSFVTHSPSGNARSTSDMLQCMPYRTVTSTMQPLNLTKTDTVVFNFGKAYTFLFSRALLPPRLTCCGLQASTTTIRGPTA